MQGHQKCILAFAAIIALFLLVFLPISFSRVRYDEYGLVQRRSTGTVDRSIVYSSGRYFLGPDSRFITFPATAQTMEFKSLSVWTKSSATDAGTAMLLDVSFQYRLRKDAIGTLYELVALNYEQLIKNVALNTLKNNATRFSADEWVRSRRTIQTAMRATVNAVLIKSANVDCLHLQLRQVTFPASYVARRLDAAIQLQRNAEEAYKQTATITRAETSRLVLEIENDASVVKQAAVADAGLIEAVATNKAKDYSQRARSKGLKLVVDAINVSNQSEIISLDWLLSIKDHAAGAQKYVNFPYQAVREVAGVDSVPAAGATESSTESTASP